MAIRDLDSQKMFLIGQALQKHCPLNDYRDECFRFRDVGVVQGDDGDAIFFTNARDESFKLTCQLDNLNISCDLFKQFKYVKAGGCGCEGGFGTSMTVLDTAIYDPLDIHVEIQKQPDAEPSEVSVGNNNDGSEAVSDSENLPGDTLDETEDGFQWPDVVADAFDMFVPPDTSDAANPEVIPYDAVEVNDKSEAVDGAVDSAEIDVAPHFCDPDGDGIITDAFVDPALASAIKEAMGLEPNDEIFVEDVLATTALDLSNKEISDLSGIECFENLTQLTLTDNHIEDIAPIASLSQLEHLVLANNLITSIESLSGLSELSYLNVQQNYLSTLDPLFGMTSLQHLIAGDNNISDISVVSTLSNLSTLSLRWNNITDISPVKSLAYLKHLDLAANNISNIDAVSDLTTLSLLQLGMNFIEDISPVAGLVNLTDLTFHTNMVSDISALSGLTLLHTLRMYNNDIEDISSLEYLTDLNKLWIEYNAITDITPLLNNAGIGIGDNIYLEGNEIPQEQLDALAAKGVNIY